MTTAPYQADYTTLNDVRTLKGIDAYETGDDAMLTQFIHEASDFIDTWTLRHFVPYVDTKSFAASYVATAYDLWTRDDLLAVTTLTNGDAVVIDGADFNLRPDNVYPKHTVELGSTGASWRFLYRENRITIAGIWGYHGNYARAWKAASTLNGALDNSQTNVVVNSSTAYRVLDYLLIDSEQMQVTAIVGLTLTVERAVNGTTAAAHDDSSAAKIYQQTPVIRFCANQIVKWMYEKRDQSEGAVQLAQDLGVVIVQELPQVKKLLDKFTPLVERIGAV